MAIIREQRAKPILGPTTSVPSRPIANFRFIFPSWWHTSTAITAPSPIRSDGYTPRPAGEAYPRPYNISPVETDRQFPLYFPELVAYIDSHYRPIADQIRWLYSATSGRSLS